jgi:hypothetical protein
MAHAYRAFVIPGELLRTLQHEEQSMTDVCEETL